MAVPHHNTVTDLDELDGIGRLPGLAPDPLFAEQSAVLGPLESHAFWVTLRVPATAEPGLRELDVLLTLGDDPQPPLRVSLDVRPLVVEPRRDFPVTHWFYADALCDWYKVEPFEERFWDIAKRYMLDLTEHGNDSLYVPIFTPPTDGVKRPTQLLRVSEPAPDHVLLRLQRRAALGAPGPRLRRALLRMDTPVHPMGRAACHPHLPPQ